MSVVDFKALFEKHLALPEFTITDYKESETTTHFHIEKREKPSVCPSCGVFEPRLRVHGSREQDVRDINVPSTIKLEYPKLSLFYFIKKEVLIWQ